MSERVTRNGFWMSEQEAAAWDARMADDEIKFAGRTRTSTMHLIAGAAKQRRDTTSVCGQRVGNTWRVPSAGEKVCKICQKGTARTAFSAHNQPRRCEDCGRMYADNASRDNTDRTCPECYEAAGRENAHLDGYHKDEPDDECPMCQDAAAAPAETTEAAPERAAQAEEVAVAETESAAVESAEASAAAAQAEYEEAEARFALGVAERRAAVARERLSGSFAALAARFRRLADDIERRGVDALGSISADGVDPLTQAAAAVANDIGWALGNASVGDLLRDAARAAELDRAEREARRAVERTAR